MITFSDVRKDYHDLTVLGPVTGQIAAGGMTALIGPNGAGKSTLLTIIGRLMDPSAGHITVKGQDLSTTGSSELAKLISILRQENHMTARLTVRDLVGFGRYPHSKGRLTPACHGAIDSALDFLNLTDLQDRFMDQLSGGQRQRAFVAMILAQDTEYVLLDEPLNNLDMKHAVLMMRQLRRAADELGKTVVIVIHDINFAAAYADHIIALRDGDVVHVGSPEEIMRDAVLTDVFDTGVQVHEIAGRRTAVFDL
ncbi:ABC transporter ATP-binding protein [Zhihengliuella somnathii]